MTDLPPLPDPRPRVIVEDGVAYVEGARCRACAYPVATPGPRCPVCSGELAPARFGPRGVVWASTVVRVRVPGRNAPYGLAYLDLQDGPRILVHVTHAGDLPVPVGADARLVGTTPDGDLSVDVEATP